MTDFASGQEIARHEVWGFPVTPMSVSRVLEVLEVCWTSESSHTILFQNLHTMYLQTSNERYRSCFENSVVLIDGTPLVRLLRRAGHQVTNEDRAAAIDLVHPTMALAAKDGRRVFVNGQEEHVLHKALAVLRMAHPGLEIDGHHGFFDRSSHAADHVFEASNKYRADLVLIGLGSPDSEIWIDDNRDRFDAPVVWACGALMEYVAGYAPTPPRWSGSLGVEWLFRFANDPLRFLTRYFAEPAVLAGRVAIRSLRSR